MELRRSTHRHISGGENPLSKTNDPPPTTTAPYPSTTLALIFIIFPSVSHLGLFKDGAKDILMQYRSTVPVPAQATECFHSHSPRLWLYFALVKTEFEKAINTHTCTAGYLHSMWRFELGMWISFELLVTSPETLETVASYEIALSVCSNIIVVICLRDRENMGHADLSPRVCAAALRVNGMTSYTMCGSV